MIKLERIISKIQLLRLSDFVAAYTPRSSQELAGYITDNNLLGGEPTAGANDQLSADFQRLRAIAYSIERPDASISIYQRLDLERFQSEILSLQGIVGKSFS